MLYIVFLRLYLQNTATLYFGDRGGIEFSILCCCFVLVIFTMTTITPEKLDFGDFVSWLYQFDCCAAANGWDDTKRLAILPVFLHGPAASHYFSLTGDQRDAFASLVKHLRVALCPAINREKYFAAFKQRFLPLQEDPSLFLWDLKDALLKANPNLAEDTRDALLPRQFMKGLLPDL